MLGPVFFQGEFLSGNFALVFQQCFHSSWRTEAAVLSLINKKGQTAVPSRQDKHAVLLGGQPHAAGARWRRRRRPRERSRAFLFLLCLSFMQKPARECTGGLLSKAPLQQFVDCTYAASRVKMLRSSLRKETSFTQTRFKMGLYRRMSMDIIIVIKGYLFTESQKHREF